MSSVKSQDTADVKNVKNSRNVEPVLFFAEKAFTKNCAANPQETCYNRCEVLGGERSIAKGRTMSQDLSLDMTQASGAAPEQGKNNSKRVRRSRARAAGSRQRHRQPERRDGRTGKQRETKTRERDRIVAMFPHPCPPTGPEVDQADLPKIGLCCPTAVVHPKIATYSSSLLPSSVYILLLQHTVANRHPFFSARYRLRDTKAHVCTCASWAQAAGTVIDLDISSSDW